MWVTGSLYVTRKTTSPNQGMALASTWSHGQPNSTEAAWEHPAHVAASARKASLSQRLVRGGGSVYADKVCQLSK